MSVLKSDRDYFFTLPVRPRDLSLALYIAYMLLSGVYTLAFIGVYELLLGVPPLLSVVSGMFTVPPCRRLASGAYAEPIRLHSLSSGRSAPHAYERPVEEDCPQPGGGRLLLSARK